MNRRQDGLGGDRRFVLGCLAVPVSYSQYH